MGRHQSIASPPMRTQHKCQKELFIKKNMGCHQYTASPPMRIQHECHKGLVIKKHGLLSVHSAPPNENTASVPKGVVYEKNIGCHQQTASPPMRIQHECHKGLVKTWIQAPGLINRRRALDGRSLGERSNTMAWECARMFGSKLVCGLGVEGRAIGFWRSPSIHMQV